MSSPRKMALDAVIRIESGERSGPVLGSALAGAADLDRRDRAFVTNLVQGTIRMRRACDHVIDPHLQRRPDPEIRSLLRLGAYQLLFLDTPPHAAVGESVELAPKRAQGFVNAVLRKVARDAEAGVEWPSAAVKWSYPDWLVAHTERELGEDAAPTLRAMNRAEQPPARPDGYIQGLASQWVVDEVAVVSNELAADLCAAPGGKATGLAADGATVVAAEIAEARIASLASTAAEFGEERTFVVRADAAAPPFKPGAFDRVLVDAPCSGLGALGRRSDARWRVKERDIARLATVQRRLMNAAIDLVRPGGTLVYAVCTITAAETTGVIGDIDSDDRLAPAPLVHGDRWRALGTSGNAGLVLPHDHGTDGMAVARWTRR